MASQIHHWDASGVEFTWPWLGFHADKVEVKGAVIVFAPPFIVCILPHSHLYRHLNKAAGAQECHHHICSPSSLCLWDNMGPNNLYLCESFLHCVWSKLIALGSGSSEYWIQVSTVHMRPETCSVLVGGACLDPPYFFFFLSLFVHRKPSGPPWLHPILWVWYYNTNVFSMANGGRRATMKWYSEVSWPQLPLLSI